MIISKERRILNASEACQFLKAALGFFAKIANKKAKERKPVDLIHSCINTTILCLDCWISENPQRLSFTNLQNHLGKFQMSLLNALPVVNPILQLCHQHVSRSRSITLNVSTYQRKLSPKTALICYHSNSYYELAPSRLPRAILKASAPSQPT